MNFESQTDLEEQSIQRIDAIYIIACNEGDESLNEHLKKDILTTAKFFKDNCGLQEKVCDNGFFS